MNLLTTSTNSVSNFRRTLLLLDGNTLFFFYFLALARQWFWSVENQLAWVFVTVVAVALWLIYFSTKDRNSEPPDKWFCLLVVLPLVFAYALRFPFPDTSFDVWSLRLFHGERALDGFLYRPGEFFPTSAPFNPTPDIITGVFRHALGYRLGTIVNLLALLWSAGIIDRILETIVEDRRLRAFCVLLIVFVEHLLFEINNYMPDLLALPLLLEATRLTIYKQENVTRSRVVKVAFLIGVAIALKLSNGAVSAPLVLIWIWRLLKPFRPKLLITSALLSLAVTIPLLLPFTVWVYKLTGSPIFPLYNGVFRSPFFPQSNGWDDRWGGYGPWEIISWPVMILFYPQRTAELTAYSGRLSVGFIAALVCLLLARKFESRTRQLAFTIVLGSLLWSLTMGYIRYGLLLEVLSGILLIEIAATVYQKSRQRTLRTALVSAIALILMLQSIAATAYLLRMEWSQRPTVFDDFKTYRSQLHNVLRDYSLQANLPSHERQLFEQVDVWVVSGAKTTGPMILLNNKAPFIGVRSAGLFLEPATRSTFAERLNEFSDRRLSSLALHFDFGEAVYALRNVGLGVGHVENVLIPFFSPRDDLLQASFFEVTREFTGKPLPERSFGTAELSANSFRTQLSPLNATPTLKAGEILDLYVRVRNDGPDKWPSLPNRDGKYRIVLLGGWSKSDQPFGEGNTVTLPYDLPSGEAVVLLIRLRAPSEPGEYALEFDLEQQGVGRLGSPSVTAVRVEH